MENLKVILLTALLFALIIILVLLGYYLQPGLWMRCRLAGVDIGYWELVAMRWRGAPVRQVVHATIQLHRAGLLVSHRQLELLAHKGANLQNISDGLLAARQYQLPLTLEQAAAADRQGADLVKLVRLAAKKGISGKDFFL